MADLAKLLSGEASTDEEAQLLSQAVTELDAFLETRPMAEQRVQDLLDRQLKSGVTPETWSTVGDSITAFLGSEHAQLVAWLLTGDQIQGLQQLESYASPKVMAFLRSIMSIYGQDLNKAYFISDQLPHDWSYIYRNVYHDAITDSYLLRLRVEKNNGEQLYLEGEPNSFMHMTELLMRSLIALGSPEVFTEERISQFQEAAGTLLKLLSAEEEKEAGDGAEAQGKDGAED
jgi:hypothetical protein